MIGSLLSGMGVTQYIVGGLVIAMLTLGGTGYIYYKSSQSTIQNLNDKLTIATIEIETQKNTIESMEADQKAVKTAMNRMAKTTADNQAKVEELRKKFGGTSVNSGERDLGFLAYNKPGLIENVVNKATEKVIRCMEIATGAKLTVKEENEIKDFGSVRACN